MGVHNPTERLRLPDRAAQSLEHATIDCHGVRLADNQARVHWAIKNANIEELQNLLQFFCTRSPCQPNAAPMRSTAGVLINPLQIPEIYVNPISAQYQTDGRRAGLKIRRLTSSVGQRQEQ